MSVNVVVSGTVRVVSGTDTTFTKGFSATYTASHYVIRDLVLLNGASEVVLSLAEISNPGFTLVIGGVSGVRINPGLNIASLISGPSAVAFASVGIAFKDLYTQIGSGQSGPISMHFSNSSGDSATVTIVQGM